MGSTRQQLLLLLIPCKPSAAFSPCCPALSAASGLANNGTCSSIGQEAVKSRMPTSMAVVRNSQEDPSRRSSYSSCHTPGRQHHQQTALPGPLPPAPHPLRPPTNFSLCSFSSQVSQPSLMSSWSAGPRHYASAAHRRHASEDLGNGGSSNSSGSSRQRHGRVVRVEIHMDEQGEVDSSRSHHHWRRSAEAEPSAGHGAKPGSNSRSRASPGVDAAARSSSSSSGGDYGTGGSSKRQDWWDRELYNVVFQELPGKGRGGSSGGSSSSRGAAGSRGQQQQQQHSQSGNDKDGEGWRGKATSSSRSAHSQHDDGDDDPFGDLYGRPGERAGGDDDGYSPHSGPASAARMQRLRMQQRQEEEAAGRRQGAGGQQAKSTSPKERQPCTHHADSRGSRHQDAAGAGARRHRKHGAQEAPNGGGEANRGRDWQAGSWRAAKRLQWRQRREQEELERDWQEWRQWQGHGPPNSSNKKGSQRRRGHMGSRGVRWFEERWAEAVHSAGGWDWRRAQGRGHAGNDEEEEWEEVLYGARRPFSARHQQYWQQEGDWYRDWQQQQQEQARATAGGGSSSGGGGGAESFTSSWWQRFQAHGSSGFTGGSSGFAGSSSSFTGSSSSAGRRVYHPPGVTEHLRQLGMPEDGPLEAGTLKAAFRKAALLWHPDRHAGEGKAGAEEQFKKVQAAYMALQAHCA